MLDLSAFELAYVLFVLVASFAVRGSAGFGGLNGPLLMLVLPAKVIVPALVFLGVISSWAIVARDHARINWRAVRQILPYGVAGIVAGLWVFKRLDTDTIEKGLGLFIVVYGCYSLWCLLRPPKPLRVSASGLAAVMGTASGVIGTMFGALAGVFVAVFLDMLRMDKSQFRVTMAVTLLLMGIARGLGYIAVGAVTTDVLITFGIALPLMWIGVLLGHRLHAQLNQQGFSRMVGVLFVVIGGFLLLR